MGGLSWLYIVRGKRDHGCAKQSAYTDKHEAETGLIPQVDDHNDNYVLKIIFLHKITSSKMFKVNTESSFRNW